MIAVTVITVVTALTVGPTTPQVISTVLLHLHRNANELNLNHGTKTPASSWGLKTPKSLGSAPTEDEGKVVVRQGELLSGVLDKSAFGASAFGLVHCVNELLGGDATGRLLSQLGRLFSGVTSAVTSSRYIEPLHRAVTSSRYIEQLGRLFSGVTSAVTSSRYIEPLHRAVTSISRAYRHVPSHWLSP